MERISSKNGPRVIVVKTNSKLKNLLKIHLAEFKIGNTAAKPMIIALANAALDEKAISQKKHTLIMAELGI